MIVVPFIYDATLCPLTESVWEVDLLKNIDMIHMVFFEENRRLFCILKRNHKNVAMG
jgi:hypothetical protein